MVPLGVRASVSRYPAAEQQRLIGVNGDIRDPVFLHRFQIWEKNVTRIINHTETFKGWCPIIIRYCFNGEFMLSYQLIFNTIVIELGAFLSFSISSAAHHFPVKVVAAGYGAAGNSTETRTTILLFFFRYLQTFQKQLLSYPENSSMGSGHPSDLHKKSGDLSSSSTLISNSLGVVGRPAGIT